MKKNPKKRGAGAGSAKHSVSSNHAKNNKHGVAKGGVGLMMTMLASIRDHPWLVITSLATIVGLILASVELMERMKPPQVDLQNLRIFFVEADTNIYQLGLVVELANRDAKTYRIDGISARPTSLDIAGRGQNYIRKIWGDVDGRTTNDYHLEANKTALFRIKLPLKFEMTIAHPPPPEILFFGEWDLSINGKSRKTIARMVGNADNAISEDEWNALLDNVESVKRVQLMESPPLTELKGPYRNSLLFNSDQTAILNLYAFDHTLIVKNHMGQMTFVRGHGLLSLPNRWTILGHTYQEVWANPQKLAIYNSIYPPAQDGRPRPFGVFAGAENEMGVYESVPTTRGRDILRIFPSSNKISQRAVNLDLRAGIQPIKDPVLR